MVRKNKATHGYAPRASRNMVRWPPGWWGPISERNSAQQHETEARDHVEEGWNSKKRPLIGKFVVGFCWGNGGRQKRKQDGQGGDGRRS